MHTVRSQGGKGRGLFIITEGQCDVMVPDLKSLQRTERAAGGAGGESDGESEEDEASHPMAGMELVRTLGEGEWFGELSLLTNEPVTAHVIANGECVTHLLPVEDWEEMKRSHPELSMHFKATIEEMNYKMLSPFASEVTARLLTCPTHLLAGRAQSLSDAYCFSRNQPTTCFVATFWQVPFFRGFPRGITEAVMS